MELAAKQKNGGNDGKFLILVDDELEKKKRKKRGKESERSEQSVEALKLAQTKRNGGRSACYSKCHETLMLLHCVVPLPLSDDTAAIICTKHVAKRRRAWRATAKPSLPKIPSSAHRLLLVRGGLVCGSPRCQRHLPTTPPPIVWETCAFWWLGILSTITHTSISIMPGFYCGRQSAMRRDIGGGD